MSSIENDVVAEAAAGEPVLERAFKLLRVFGDAERPLSLTSLSARSGMPKTTVLRLARTLVGLGALERRADGAYTIGLGLLEIASLAPRGHGLRAKAMPYLQDLHAATAQHVALGVLDKYEAVLIERLSARGAARSPYRVGCRLPLHATAIGQCLLAHAPVEVQEDVLSGELSVLPEDARISPADLRAQLAAARTDGVAVVHRAVPENWTTVAGPVFGGSEEPVAAMAVVTRSPACTVAALRSAVATTCRALSRALQSPPAGSAPTDRLPARESAPDRLRR